MLFNMFNADRMLSWRLIFVVSMQFSVCPFNHPLNTWDVSNVEVFEGFFWENSEFNQDLDDWDTSSAVNMQSVFSRASSFNGNISTWNTTSVVNFFTFAALAQNFNTDMSQFDLTSAEDLGFMVSRLCAFSMCRCFPLLTL